MKVLFTCADKPTISRNRFHRQNLKERFEYSECISEGKTYASRIPSILSRLPFKMLGQDFYFVSYMGHFLVVFMRLFTKKPIVFDFYLSIFDMMCNDRKVYSPESFLGKVTYWIEKKSLEKADYIIVDTTKLINTLSKEYDIDKKKFVRVPLTINEENVMPKEVEPYSKNFSVLYVGSYIPLHGTPVIIEAAKILQENNEDISLLMIGKGPDLQKCQDLVKQYNLTNISQAKIMAQEDLLNGILAELNYAGISGYTIIRDEDSLKNLLFADTSSANGMPPRYAIIYYLQGDFPLSHFPNVPVSDYDVEKYISTYHWVFVQVSGIPVWGKMHVYNSYADIKTHSTPFKTNITEAGLSARKKFYAYYLYPILTYNYTVYSTYQSFYDDYVVWNATFYANKTETPEELGLAAFYVDDGMGGIVIVNGVNIDWDLTGNGVRPETVIQETVYSALYAWNLLRTS